MTYRVVWEIDVQADTPLNAAKKALDMQRDVAAAVFMVQDESGNVVDVVDLG